MVASSARVVAAVRRACVKSGERVVVTPRWMREAKSGAKSKYEASWKGAWRCLHCGDFLSEHWSGVN